MREEVYWVIRMVKVVEVGLKQGLLQEPELTLALNPDLSSAQTLLLAAVQRVVQLGWRRTHLHHDQLKEVKCIWFRHYLASLTHATNPQRPPAWLSVRFGYW